MNGRPLLALTLTALLPTAQAGEWQQPPSEILNVLHAPDLPRVWLSPTGDALLFAEEEAYPPLADLARPMLRLAGVRLDPQTSSAHGEACLRDLKLQRLDEAAARPLPLPADACVLSVAWSADGARLALSNRTHDGVDLWVGRTDNLSFRSARGLRLNPMLGDELTWMPDQQTLLVKRVPADRGPAPRAPATPPGPLAQESVGATPSSTYDARDLLVDATDEALFSYYARSGLALVDSRTLSARAIGPTDLYGGVSPSPDGQHLLVATIQQPLSRRVTWQRFAMDVDVWGRDGRFEANIAHTPVADTVPIHGVPVGRRGVAWQETAPATLVWLEALDGGDPAKPAPKRDRVHRWAAPFEGSPTVLFEATHRVTGLWWGEGDLALLREHERERRWEHVWRLHPDTGAAPAPLFDYSQKDHYGDPGAPVTRVLPSGRRVLLQDQGRLFLSGDGGSPEGDRPFLDRLDLDTGARQRLFRSEPTAYERFVGWVNLAEGRFLTRRESESEVPNYFTRTLGPATQAGDGEASFTSAPAPVTHFSDPAPEVRGITKRVLTYSRADGVPLSLTLYLPPGYQPGARLPTVLTAYPLEYSDASTAGQITGSEHTFVRLRGTSALFLLLSGYAVLANTAMPVIGDPETAYDTFVEQLVADASAAIDAAVAEGVTDRARVGVLGHSHGGLMVATLLAHSDLFRAGIARSGAYNHTFRPFGFQNERRTLWEAKDTYLALSPLLFADQINEPILIIHGAEDQNPGTVPVQSQKLYEAVRGTGGTARLLLLPHEGHGYRAKESVEQVLAEQLAWFDRWVKPAPGQ